MEISGRQCETCTKQHLFDWHRMGASGAYPVGWMSLYYQDSPGMKEPMHFCSVACLQEWATKRVALQQPQEILPKGTELTPGRRLAVDLPIVIEKE